MSWINTFDSTFFLSVGSVLLAALGVASRYCFKSKCSEFSVCCGLLKIKRDVEAEVKEDLAELEMGKKHDDDKNDPIA
jgi:hypothetical protein